MTTRSFVRSSAALFLLLAAGPSFPASFPVSASGGASFVPGQVIVKFKPGKAAAARTSTSMLRSNAVIQELAFPDTLLVAVPDGQSVEAAVAAYRGDPTVEYAQPNYVYSGQAVPNDPSYGQLWGLKNTGQTITNGLNQPVGSEIWFDIEYPGSNPGFAGQDIRAEAAWDAFTDCSSVVVAVVDSGVNYDHEDLAANMWSSPAYPKHGKDFVNGTDDPKDDQGHGTHVAGTIGAVGNNRIGVAGVCWKASIMAVKVLNANNRGTTANIIQGMDFAVVNGAKVINMSIIGYNPFDRIYSEAVNRALNADVVVVVCAGNDKKDNDAPRTNAYPCNFSQPNLICVAALDQKYELAGFSNYGATTVMLGAPGSNIASTWIGTSENVNFAINDPPSPDWTLSPGAPGGWGYQALPSARGPVACLTDPTTFPSGTYQAGTDARAWRALPIGQADKAMLKLVLTGAVETGDYFRIAFRAGPSAADPFDGGTVLNWWTGWRWSDSNLDYSWNLEFDVAQCIASPACSIGFQLQSAAESSGKGMAVGKVRVETFTRNDTSYNILYGTSMATPLVAGVATMLRAYNPRYTHADVVAAIKAGGVPVPSLDGKTQTGKALSAIGTLSHLQPITGVSAVVQ